MYSVESIVKAGIPFKRIIRLKFLCELIKAIRKTDNIALLPDDLNQANLIVCFKTNETKIQEVLNFEVIVN